MWGAPTRIFLCSGVPFESILALARFILNPRAMLFQCTSQPQPRQHLVHAIDGWAGRRSARGSPAATEPLTKPRTRLRGSGEVRAASSSASARAGRTTESPFVHVSLRQPILADRWSSTPFQNHRDRGGGEDLPRTRRHPSQNGISSRETSSTADVRMAPSIAPGNTRLVSSTVGPRTSIRWPISQS